MGAEAEATRMINAKGAVVEVSPKEDHMPPIKESERGIFGIAKCSAIYQSCVNNHHPQTPRLAMDISRTDFGQPRDDVVGSQVRTCHAQPACAPAEIPRAVGNGISSVPK